MKCVICRSDEIQSKAVHEAIHRGNDIVRIPIETLVCGQCGERYYDRATMQRLERIRKNIQEEKVQLDEIGKVLLCKD